MKTRLLFLLFFVLSFTQLGTAQFQISSFTPSHGSQAVTLTQDVVFTFNQPLQALETIQLGEMFLVFPMDSVSINEMSVSEDQLSLTLNVTHTENTDFTWVVIDLRNEDNEPLEQAYTFSYTTSEAIGAHSISGFFSEREVDIPMKSTQTKVQSFLNPSIKWYSVNKNANRTYLTKTNIAELNFSHSLVLLTTTEPDIFDEDEEEQNEEKRHFFQTMEEGDGGENEGGGGPPEGVVSVTTGTAEGNFEVPFVRNGSYYMAAYLFEPYFDEDTQMTEIEVYAVGIYDADEDMTPDLITVEDADVEDIEIGVITFSFDFEPVDISAVFDKISEQITELVGTHTVFFVNGEESTITDLEEENEEENVAKNAGSNSNLTEFPAPTGTAYIWSLLTHVPDSNAYYVFVSTPLGMFYFTPDTVNEEGENEAPIPSTIVPITSFPMGSAEAVAIAEANGGADFRAEQPVAFGYPELSFTYTASANFLPEVPLESSGSIWIVNYEFDSYNEETQEYEYSNFDVVVDANTKEVLFSGDLDVSTEEEFNVPSFQLAQNFPNPFNPSTHIAFTLPTTSNVKLSVYSNLGQLVQVLTNQQYARDRKSVV